MQALKLQTLTGSNVAQFSTWSLLCTSEACVLYEG